jgi:hypothetical protein
MLIADLCGEIVSNKRNAYITLISPAAPPYDWKWTALTAHRGSQTVSNVLRARGFPYRTGCLIFSGWLMGGASANRSSLTCTVYFALLCSELGGAIVSRQYRKLKTLDLEQRILGVRLPNFLAVQYDNSYTPYFDSRHAPVIWDPLSFFVSLFLFDLNM